MRIAVNFDLGSRQATIHGELGESATAQAIAAALPVRARASTWGDEIYFGIPVSAPLEPGATDLQAVGDLAYWPPGRAFCIFFGRTPASHAGEPRAASPVNLIGRLELEENTIDLLKGVPSGTKVTITAV